MRRSVSECVFTRVSRGRGGQSGGNSRKKKTSKSSLCMKCKATSCARQGPILHMHRYSSEHTHTYRGAVSMTQVFFFLPRQVSRLTITAEGVTCCCLESWSAKQNPMLYEEPAAAREALIPYPQHCLSASHVVFITIISNVFRWRCDVATNKGEKKHIKEDLKAQTKAMQRGRKTEEKGREKENDGHTQHVFAAHMLAPLFQQVHAFK